MKIQKTLLFHFTPVRIGNIQRTTKNNCWRKCGEKRIHSYWWDSKLLQPVWVWKIPKKLNINLHMILPYPYLAYAQRNWVLTANSVSHVHCCSSHNSQERTQPTCPSTDKCILKMWYIYTIEYYAAVKKNELINFVGKWVELDKITLNELMQMQKDKCHILLTGGS